MKREREKTKEESRKGWCKEVDSQVRSNNEKTMRGVDVTTSKKDEE